MKCFQQNIELELYPDGGYLVSGLNNTVYFEALTPSDEPVDLIGELVVVDRQKDESEWTVVTQLTAVHEGRGKFTFIPNAGNLFHP
jgi:hypothetical protein